MNSQVLAAPLEVTHPRRRRVALALAAALLGALLTFAALTAIGHGDSPAKPKSTELRGPGFALAYPGGWNQVAAGRGDGKPAAILRREDGKAAVVVRAKKAPRDQSLRSLTRDLNKTLAGRFPDFRFVSARVAPVRGGNAFLYTFVRTRQKTAQSIVLVKVGATTYTLDSVARGGDPRAAQEVAAIVRSFGP